MATDAGYWAALRDLSWLLTWMAATTMWTGAPVLEPASPLRSFQSLHRGSLDSNVVSGLAGYRSGSPTQAEGSSSLWSRLSLDGAAPSPKAGRPNLSTASVPVSPSKLSDCV